MKFKKEKYTCKCGHVITVEYDEDEIDFIIKTCIESQKEMLS